MEKSPGKVGLLIAKSLMDAGICAWIISFIATLINLSSWISALSTAIVIAVLYSLTNSTVGSWFFSTNKQILTTKDHVKTVIGAILLLIFVIFSF